MTTEILYKVSCQACGNHIAFPTEYLDQTIPCPHCGQLAHLSPPVLEPEPHRVAESEVRQEKRRSIPAAWWAVVVVILVAAAWFGFVYFRLHQQIEITSAQLLPGEYPDYFVKAKVKNHSRCDISRVTVAFEFKDAHESSLEKKSASVSSLKAGQHQTVSLPAPQDSWNVTARVVRIRPGLTAWFKLP